MDDNLFEKLSSENQKKIKSMVLEQSIQAILELKSLTGYSLDDGKIFVNKIREEAYYESLPPCPYCGQKLRTREAKQCRYCLRDWHDVNELKWLK